MLMGGRAHPRACGENAHAAAVARGCRGSSPRVRGKHGGRGDIQGRFRLIPARAGKTRSSEASHSPAQAHPRACGENVASASKWGGHHGSSPRVRGKPLLLGLVVQARRLIPARAGKTSARSRSPPSRRAHPRACGENRFNTDALLRDDGSSPRVRGKPARRDRRAPPDRLIPARAGKTSTSPTPRRSRSAHPRACGENLNLADPASFPLGSSPRVRGKLPPGARADTASRLIPARAGKTRSSAPSTPPCPAHPRACGENRESPCDWHGVRGSSPRVRGKLRPPTQGARAPGLIPARAGKTPCGPGGPRTWRAHPRACGENPRQPAVMTNKAGSSPRVRGKRPGLQRHPARRRLIPARAGKTSFMSFPSWVGAAHPRACGENLDLADPASFPLGSSPRVRGKLPHVLRGRLVAGLIPARAGKTTSPSGVSPAPAAHPRACGENFQTTILPRLREGSSPRVRGKRNPAPGPRRLEGLIPARAGKTLPDLGFYRSGRSDLGNPRAFRLFWKLLIPGRPRKRRAVSGASAGSVYWPRPWASAGRIMSRMPSKSTGRQGSPQVRNSRPCSLRAL